MGYFSRKDLQTLGGTSLQKIAVLKLLLAIAQAAATPEDDAAWQALGPAGLAQACLDYLKKHRGAFWLHGDKPFLQMPAVRAAKLTPYGSIMPEIASGNTTVHTQMQVEAPQSEAQRALLLLVNLSCCFSGKNVDKTVVLSPGFSKSASAKAGPAICSLGLLHTFLTGRSLQETLWLNLLTMETIRAHPYWSEGLGVPPWEDMPEGEDCPVARALCKSYMGRLVPLARFCLLEDAGLRYVEGIQHPDYLEGATDPSMTGDMSGTKPKMLWADPEKRPWRLLTALLSFLESGGTGKMCCPLLQMGIPRLRDADVPRFGIWCGGIKTRSNAGQQYLSGNDDVVDSELMFETSMLKESWYMNMKINMAVLDSMAKALYGAVSGYFKEAKAGNADDLAKRATSQFWQRAERHFAALSIACMDTGGAGCPASIRAIAAEIDTVYSNLCPQDTARQLQAWAAHRPRLGKLLAANA